MSGMGWPFDPTVYLGLVLLYLGHAWLARGAPDLERKHTLYFGLGLVTIWVALESPIDISPTTTSTAFTCCSTCCSDSSPRR